MDEWQEEGEDHGVDYAFSNDTKGLVLIKVAAPQPTEFTIKGQRKNAYYNFVVDDIQIASEHLQQNGVKTTDIHDYGVMKGFDFFDPDNNPFSIVSEETHSPLHQ